MFYKKNETPGVGEIALCTVKRITNNAVFVYLIEYDQKEGMIHISEIAPGRIRNIRDYVKEGKTIVCKVLRVHEKGHIDLSLRRVGTSFKIQKLTEYKQEEKAEKLLELIGKELKKDLAGMYTLVGEQAREHYGGLFPFFQEIVARGVRAVTDLGVGNTDAEVIATTVTEKIPQPEIAVEGKLTLFCPEPDGVVHIREGLRLAQQTGEHILIQYVSAPHYAVRITATDYQEAETVLQKMMHEIEQYSSQHGCVVSFEKK